MLDTTKKARVSRTGNYRYGSLQIHELSTPWTLHAALVFPFQNASNTIRKFRKGQQWPPLVCNGFCMRNKTVGSLPPNKLMIQDAKKMQGTQETIWRENHFRALNRLTASGLKTLLKWKLLKAEKLQGGRSRMIYTCPVSLLPWTLQYCWRQELDKIDFFSEPVWTFWCSFMNIKNIW